MDSDGRRLDLDCLRADSLSKEIPALVDIADMMIELLARKQYSRDLPAGECAVLDAQTVHTKHLRGRDSARRSNFNPFESWAVYTKSSVRYRRPSGHVMEPERLHWWAPSYSLYCVEMAAWSNVLYLLHIRFSRTVCRSVVVSNCHSVLTK